MAVDSQNKLKCARINLNVNSKLKVAHGCFHQGLRWGLIVSTCLSVNHIKHKTRQWSSPGVSLLTLFTLHSSVVAHLLESDISQVQDSSHNLKHHGAVLRWDANHIHGMLGKEKIMLSQGRSVGLLTPVVPSSCPLITLFAVSLVNKTRRRSLEKKTKEDW